MANYNREILVPYLRDVCSVEMLCQKLEREKRQCQAKVNECTEKLRRTKRDVPNKHMSLKDYINAMDLSWDNVFMGILGIGLIVLGIILKRVGLFLIPKVVGFLGIALTIIWLLMIFLNIDTDKERNKERYDENTRYNSMLDKETPVYEENLKRHQSAVSYLQRKLNDAYYIRQQVYSVNIIPNRYRNAHVAYYLYDFFNTCRETDLEKVIQTMLLDEIVQRLDKIIVQNEAILLNQRYQMALQEKQNAMIASNHREQMNRIARLERNQELQMDYQNMIAANQSVTNFILTMDYLDRKF